MAHEESPPHAAAGVLSDCARSLAGDIRASATRLARHVLRTPMIASSALAASVWLKCENLQRTGSFKLRGALNKMQMLSSADRDRGIVTSSTGNHGLAIAESLRIAGGRGTVVVSSSAAPHKVERLRDVGLEVIVEGDDPMHAELGARLLAERTGRVYVSPYNDWDVVAGQGTVAVEIIEQLPNVDTIYVAVGGGGLVAGIAAFAKSVKPSIRVVGCWPANATAMHSSILAGRIVEADESPTLSDGTAGNVEPGAITFPLCRELIDDYVLVSESKIADAMRDVFRADGMAIEGAAGVAVAAWRAAQRGECAVIVLCGGNVSAKITAGAMDDQRA